MNKKHLFFLVVFMLLLGFIASKYMTSKSVSTQKTSVAKEESATYWTCPMHPQIHKDGPGECPICHMKLVEVKKSPEKEESQKNEERSVIYATRNQLELIGNQKVAVERMDLNIKIPISGRFVSSTSVVFQIYENDLRYVKSGMSFTGESSVSSNSEITGVITSVDSVIDPTSRTVRVVGSVRKSPAGLISETSFSGSIELKLSDRIAIPESSVLHSGNGDIVYLVGKDNKLTAKKVRLGLKSESYFEILDGLSVGDFISSGPNFLLDSEAKIRGAND